MVLSQLFLYFDAVCVSVGNISLHFQTLIWSLIVTKHSKATILLKDLDTCVKMRILSKNIVINRFSLSINIYELN